MAEIVRTEVRDGVAILTLTSPPLNLLSRNLRDALDRAFNDLQDRADVGAVVLAGEGEVFAGGTELTYHYAENEAPTLAGLCASIDASDKPVVAALQGSVLGGGLELALAADVRVAETSCVFGFPGVALGLIPSGGGTQRLPRLVGAANALTLLTTGRRITCEDALGTGLIDRVAEGDLLTAALDMAQALRDQDALTALGRGDAPGFAAPADYLAEIEAERARLSTNRRVAIAKTFACVEAALLLPFAAGQALETLHHEECLRSEQAQALRHVWLSERRLKTVQRQYRHICIIGAGSLGLSLAHQLGWDGGLISVIDPDYQVLNAAQARYAKLLEHDREEADLLAAGGGHVSFHPSCEPVVGADLIVCTTSDYANPDHPVAQALAALLPAHTTVVLAMSDTLEDRSSPQGFRPAETVAIHGLGHATSDRLVEIVTSASVKPQAVSDAAALANQLGKLPVHGGEGRDIASGALIRGLMHATDWFLRQGLSPYQIDLALRQWGMSMGPFRLADQIGLDSVLENLSRATAAAAHLQETLSALIERGRLGRSVGKGFYRYGTENGKASSDPEVLDMLEQILPLVLGADPAGLNDDAVAQMVQCGLANTGAWLLENRISRVPSDIDLVMVYGFGYPRWRGGPMLWADQQGLLKVRNLLAAQFQKTGDPLWAPANLFDELIKNGRGFSALNPDAGDELYPVS